jgi:hypothetical protein
MFASSIIEAVNAVMLRRSGARLLVAGEALEEQAWPNP